MFEHTNKIIILWVLTKTYYAIDLITITEFM